MEETRASLADKLETLEAQVRETVQTASSAVENVKDTVACTVENVKETVETVTESVSSVADKLDPRGYFEEHPFTAFGAAVGVGFLGGLLTGGTSSSGGQAWSTSSAPPSSYGPSPTSASYSAPREQESGGLFSGGLFREAADKLKGLAIGTLMGYLREMVSTSSPEMWKNDLTGMLDNITTQLGGKVIHHPSLAPNGSNGAHCDKTSERPASSEMARADM